MNSMAASSRSPRYTQQDLLRVFLRNDLYAFVQKVFETVNPGVVFSRNWSTEAATHALQKVVSGATTRLIINIPPRNLKSICASVAMSAFLLGHNPTRKVGRAPGRGVIERVRRGWPDNYNAAILATSMV
jgi:hypothetical protein